MDIPNIKFKHSIPLQIRFNDIDALGHINNNIFFSFFDLGKTTYFENIKAQHFTWFDGAIVLARIETDFYSPVYYKEAIAVDTKIAKLGNKSGTFIQQIRNVVTGEVKCRAKSIFVAYNPDLQTSMPIPRIWKDAIEHYEEVTAEEMEG